MSITVDKIRVEGRSIFIRSNPVTGILALTSFSDNSAGESGGNTFTKSFRYSINGVTFSDWYALTITNITSIQVAQKNTLIIELQYFKNEPPDIDVLTVTQATLNTTDSPILPGDYFKKSVFANYFGTEDLGVLNWYINVLDKLYQRGLLPNYIERLNSFGRPDDFLEFWKGICKFFAYYVTYARTFQKFYESETLLSEYLEQRGLNVSPNEDLEGLQNLMKTFYNQILKRGTGAVAQSAIGDTINGELLRLIYFNIDIDEFIFNPNKIEHFGWNLGNSSPLYRGMTIHSNANKFYEKDYEPSNISLYPTTGTVAVATDSGIGKKVINITGAGGIVNVDGSKKIKVDDHMDYEFSFYIKKSDGNTLNVGFTAYDADGNVVNLVSRTDGTTLNNYFVNKNIQRADKYIYVRVFLYNKLKPLSATDGLNLKMIEGVTYVIPKITIASGTASIYNIRFLPMRTNYSKGLLQVNNWIDCWLKNNNHKYTLDQIKTYIRKYLIDYDENIEIVSTIYAGDYSVESIIDELIWVGGNPYCQRDIWIPANPSCEVENLYWIPEEATAFCESE